MSESLKHKSDTNGTNGVHAEDTTSLKKRKQAHGGDDNATVYRTVNGTEWPADWPAPHGPINLAEHDLPHASADTEWWYVNSHVKTPQGREFSVFASFFRIVSQWNTTKGEYDHSHALTWAVVDVSNKQYYPVSMLDVHSVPILKKRLQPDSSLRLDGRLRRAFMEMLDTGDVPLPDRMYREEAVVATGTLNLQFAKDTFVKNEQGHYLVHCESAEKGVSFTLSFAPQKQVIRHGHDGVVKIGLKGDDMFYYFIPRLAVNGTLTLAGETHNVQGQGWYDHEFGGLIRAHKSEGKPVSSSSDAKEAELPVNTLNYGWNWLAAQLDDGTDITAATVLDSKDLTIHDNFAVVIDRDSTRHEYPEITLEGTQDWSSVRTATLYPSKWKFEVPAAQISLVLEAAFPEQECLTLIAEPAFWEGRLHIRGTIAGRPVSGLGFLERHGFAEASTSSLDKFFKAISKVVNVEVNKLMPVQPDYETVRALMADEKNDHLMRGVDLDVFAKTITQPIRMIVDRGGKSWRSYALLLCIDSVGGNSYPFRSWLAMPELMHVGSLIVDDIQDKSEIRRGGPTCHTIYGEALSINCGTAAYFLCMDIIARQTDITDKQRLRMYELFFLTLRGGHAGQAFDIYGLEYLMDDAVRTGDNQKLIEAITCTHRLKSAVPAGNLARMGAIIGGGSEEQTEALGRYFESIGVAFQIIDDVLNLRGFEKQSKDRGEDIKAGKITHPVTLAFSKNRLTLEERTWLWETIKSKPQDQKVVEAVIDKIEQCGALQESADVANTMVEEAWAVVNKVLPDSYHKMKMRAFGWYVLQRHY